jgi:flagella basal body P-ring formation protein FlgA
MIQKPCHHLPKALLLGLLLLFQAVHGEVIKENKSASLVLTEDVQMWAAKQRGLDVSQVKMQALDPRVIVKNCKKEFNFEFPIKSYESIKVSCPDPAWHMFVRMSYSQRSATLPEPSAPQKNQTEAKQATSEWRQVWVTSQYLTAGSPVSVNQVSLEKRDAGQVGLQVLDPKTDFSYMEVTHDVPSGSILRQYDIRPQTLVKRGQMVQMNVGQGSGFQISARVEALQDGRFGEQIKVKNAESGRVLSGTVKGPGLINGS